MKTKLLSFPLALSVVMVGQTSAQTATAVPSAVTTAATAVNSACTQLQTDELQNKINVTLGDASAVATSKSTLDSDHTALRTADQTLHTAIQSYLATDEAAAKTARTQLDDDFVQLKADVTAGNSSNISADETKITTDAATLKTAHAQLEADRLALANAGVLPHCGGPGGPGGPEGKRGGPHF